MSPGPADAEVASASLRRRGAALLYEALLLTAIVLVASFAIAPLVAPTTASSQHLVIPSRGGRALSFAVLFALGGVYFAWCWSRGRRTLAMKAWKLALVTADAAPLSSGRALARYVAAWIGPALGLAAYALLQPHGWSALAWPLFALNWLAALVDRDRLFLHDRVAGTILALARQ